MFLLLLLLLLLIFIFLILSIYNWTGPQVANYLFHISIVVKKKKKEEEDTIESRERERDLHLYTRFTARLVRMGNYEELLDDTFATEDLTLEIILCMSIKETSSSKTLSSVL